MKIELLNRIADAKVKDTTDLRSNLDIVYAIGMVIDSVEEGCRADYEMGRKMENKSSWGEKSSHLNE